jgi:hypothetical protein
VSHADDLYLAGRGWRLSRADGRWRCDHIGGAFKTHNALAAQRYHETAGEVAEPRPIMPPAHGGYPDPEPNLFRRNMALVNVGDINRLLRGIEADLANVRGQLRHGPERDRFASGGRIGGEVRG